MALLEARCALRIQREETERLRSSEAFLHGVLAASPDCIKVLNLEGRLEFMNGPGLRVMEVDDFARVAGVFWPGFWTGPAEAEARRAVAAAAAGSEGRFEGWADTLRGVPKLWEVSVTPILSVDGRPERLLAVSRDRTAERQAAARQTALTDLGERLREVADADTITAIVAEVLGEPSAWRGRPTASWTAPKARSNSGGTGCGRASAASSAATATRITVATLTTCAGARPWPSRMSAPIRAPR